MIRYLTNLAGLNFRPAEAKDLVLMLEPGAQINLEREPQNQYDENAIKVLATLDDPEDDTAEWTFIGYVEKLVNGPLAKDLDDGKQYTAFVQKTYPEGDEENPKAWMRPLIEVNVG